MYVYIYYFQVKQFLRTDRQTNIASKTESTVAIRLGKLKECLQRRGIENDWSEREVRDNVETFGLGNISICTRYGNTVGYC